MNATGIPAIAIKACLVMALAAAAGSCILVAPEPSGAKGGHDVVICHKGKKTMTLPREAVAAHMDHGDRHGPC
jgi:hypothetical protein